MNVLGKDIFHTKGHKPNQTFQKALLTVDGLCRLLCGLVAPAVKIKTVINECDASSVSGFDNIYQA